MKMIKNLKLGLAALLLLGSAAAEAADTNVGTGGAAFMKIPTGSARSQALGNSGVSILDGADAMNVNPAGIASAQMREFSFSYMSWFQDYSGQYAAYVHPIGQSVLGVNMAYYGIDGFDARDTEGKPQFGDDIKVKNVFASVTLAKGFFLERLLLGASIKGVLEDNYVSEYKSVVYDLGMILKLGRKLSLGWSAQNLSGSKERVVKVNRLGAAFSPNPFLTYVVDSRSYSDRKAKLGGGVEFNLPEEVLQVGRVTFRAGYADSDPYGKSTDKTLDTLGLSNSGGWTFGVGIYSSQALGYGVALDYSMVPYGALGKANQIAVKLQF